MLINLLFQAKTFPIDSQNFTDLQEKNKTTKPHTLNNYQIAKNLQPFQQNRRAFPSILKSLNYTSLWAFFILFTIYTNSK